jgi:hypothetical protein
MLTANERDRLIAEWEQWDRHSEAYIQAIRSGFGTSARAIQQVFGRDADAGTAGSHEDPRPGPAAT